MGVCVGGGRSRAARHLNVAMHDTPGVDGVQPRQKLDAVPPQQALVDVSAQLFATVAGCEDEPGV